jgi:hypothetical protein
MHVIDPFQFFLLGHNMDLDLYRNFTMYYGHFLNIDKNICQKLYLFLIINIKSSII